MTIELPLRTIVKILAAIAITSLVMHVWPILLLLFLALLLAVTLEPLVQWTERFIPRGVTVALVATLTVGAVALIIFAIGPPLFEQIANLFERWPDYSQKLMAQLPESGMLHKMGERLIKSPATTDPQQMIGHVVTAGQMAIGGISATALILVAAIYILIDGSRAYNWLLAFAPRARRAKVDQTAREVSRVISAYVAGQVITSLACSAFVFVLLHSLGVGNALILAVLAGALDVLPILGVTIAIIPAVLFALAVSPSTAIFVVVGFGFYHVIENYMLVPAVYGNRLRVSALTVLLSLLFGISIGGILGAIAILPIVASYPIIERIWLAEYLGYAVIKKHADADREEAAAVKT